MNTTIYFPCIPKMSTDIFLAKIELIWMPNEIARVYGLSIWKPIIVTFHCRSMFDECELELLLCGVSEYSLAELKKHNIIVLGLSSKLKTWFWMALSHFTPEQFARLLQFTTGSSQLPPGGFADLKPLFQIAPTHKQDSLPIAHTCFNMICLSDHSSFQSFEKALLTAINDGGEGFELAWYSEIVSYVFTLRCQINSTRLVAMFSS